MPCSSWVEDFWKFFAVYIYYFLLEKDADLHLNKLMVNPLPKGMLYVHYGWKWHPVYVALEKQSKKWKVYNYMYKKHTDVH